MKNIRKYILAVVAVLLAVPMAQAQKPYTGEWVVKSSGKLLFTIYDNGKNLRINYILEDTGQESQYIIFGKDSLCMLMPDAKGYGVFTGESLKKKKREILGFDVEELSSSVEYEFVKDEIISGLQCKMYHYTAKDVTRATSGELSSIREGGRKYDIWISSEIRHSVQEENPNYGRIETMTNIRFGMPSADLFVIPKGWKRISMDAMADEMNKQMKSDVDEYTKKVNELKDMFDSQKKGGKSNKNDINSILKELNMK